MSRRLQILSANFTNAPFSVACCACSICRRLRSAKAPAVQHANPQAAALSSLLHVDMDAATSLYALVASLALELAGMAAMMRAEAPTGAKPAAPTLPATPAEEAAPQIEPGIAPKPAAKALRAKRPLMIAGTVMSEPPSRPLGDIRRFLLACLPRNPGEEVSLGAVYARYQRWCDETEASPLSASEFAEEFKAISMRYSLPRCEASGLKGEDTTMARNVKGPDATDQVLALVKRTMDGLIMIGPASVNSEGVFHHSARQLTTLKAARAHLDEAIAIMERKWPS
jgi:hypothetical protein